MSPMLNYWKKCLVSKSCNFQNKDVMRSINGLKESTKYARDQYVSWKQSYIKESFGRPLEKLHVIFSPLIVSNVTIEFILIFFRVSSKRLTPKLIVATNMKTFLINWIYLLTFYAKL